MISKFVINKKISESYLILAYKIGTKKERLSKNNNTSSKGKIIVATVQGDIHDIGKNIVKIMLENYGYEVIDLGKDVPIEEVADTVKELIKEDKKNEGNK